jgi:alanyl-tRNA synthetase
MTPDEAIKNGALALFGEKYGEEVRVLAMGTLDACPYSVELCGGTHVGRLGDIGLFKIVGESAVASGVRRIEALTGEAARRYLLDQEELARRAASVLKVSIGDLPARVSALVEDRRKLEREVQDLRRKAALGGADAGAPTDDVEEINGIKLIARQVEGVTPKDLRGLVDDAKKRIGSGVIALGCESDGKGAIAVGVTADLADKISAVDLVRLAAEALGGKGGGGRPDMAQAGGPDGSKIKSALRSIGERLKSAEATA